MEKLSATKFVKGFAPTGFVKAFSIGCKIAIILLAGWLIWVGLIKPHYDPIKTTQQVANRDFTNINVYREDARFFGLKFGWIKLGIDIPKKEAKILQIEKEGKNDI